MGEHRLVRQPSGSATDESRVQYIANVLLLTHLVAVPVAVAGVVSLVRNRALRPLGWTVAGTVVAYLVLGGKSYYALPVVLFALAAGAVRSSAGRPDGGCARSAQRSGCCSSRCCRSGCRCCAPHGRPARDLGARSDYQDEVGWHALARNAERLSGDADVVLTLNYGEAGALELFGRNLPPVASGHVTFRYWRPAVEGRRALLVGFTQQDASFCRGYHAVAASRCRWRTKSAADRSRAAPSTAASRRSGRES